FLDMLTEVLAIVAGVAIVLAAALAGRLVAVRRRGTLEVERLRDDLHRMLAANRTDARLPVNGRDSAFVDITASINRLLDRQGESEPDTRQLDLFAALAATLPDVALVHSDTIHFANPAAAGLFGVDTAALVGKPFTDLLRPAYRALARKHLGGAP